MTISINIIKLWAVIADYYYGINTVGYCFKDRYVIDGITDDGLLDEGGNEGNIIND